MKIAVIGNIDTIKGFKALGLDIFGIKSKEEARKALLSIYSGKDYALVFLTEDWLIELRDKIKQFEERSLPALMVIPSVGSKKSIAQEELGRIIERAVGSDIFSKE